MSKIFISYRRKSWSFTHLLVEELRWRLDAELFVDYAGVDQTDFEKSILGHLRKSQAVLLVVSEQTFTDRIYEDDDWVRREIREALRLEIPLVLICVEGLLPPAGLPDDIKDVARMQGINFYPDYFGAAVDKLAEFVVTIGVAQMKVSAAGALAPSLPDEKQITGRATLDEALRLLDEGDYNKAIFLLEELRETGYASRYVDMTEVIRKAQADQQEAERRRKAQLDYDDIKAFAASAFTLEAARAAFATWRTTYPDLIEAFDTHKLRDRFRPPPVFEWLAIHAGLVTLGTYQTGGYLAKPTRLEVPAFAITRYPITNVQFAQFIEAGGYQHQGWWTEAGWAIKQKEAWSEPRFWGDRKWNGDDDPVVGVSWFEALAFCRWLSAVSGQQVRLPSEQEWQRAAQGDDGRVYPWGDDWDAERCHNGVNKKQSRTASARAYEGKGDSPFGVVGMAGNVWEWCSTSWETGEDSDEGSGVRLLRGGSWFESNAVSFRADYRDRGDPGSRNFFIGFRIARLIG